jgi:hypothetical protein
MKESSINAVLGLGGELLRNTDEPSSSTGALAPLVDPVLDGGFPDGRLAGAGALRGFSLTVLALLLFGVDFDANLSSKADFKMASACAFGGDVLSSRVSATFDDDDLTNVGVGRGR